MQKKAAIRNELRRLYQIQFLKRKRSQKNSSVTSLPFDSTFIQFQKKVVNIYNDSVKK